MNNLRKFVASSVIVMTAVSMSCVSMVSASAQAGDLIKTAGSTQIYYLSADGSKYPFADAATYYTWYKDTSGVVTVSADELSSYATGVKILVRPGTKLVKKTTDKSVYAVEPNGVLRRIADPADAVALWGKTWGHNIVIISSLDGYVVGTQLESHQYTAGSLIKQNNVTYYFDGSAYQKFTSNSFAANKFSTTYVLTAPAGQVLLPLGADITGVQENLSAINKANGGATVVNNGSSLTVALASNTAAANTVISGQASTALASFNFTAPASGSVTVSSLKLKRVGVSSDSTLNNLYLYDGNNKLTDNGSLSSGYVTFAKGGGIFTVPAGSTKTITVKSDIPTNLTGGTVGMSINAASDVVATGVIVNGSFPAVGNLMSVVSTPTDLAQVYFGNVSIPANSVSNTINAGTVNATLWSDQVTVNQKAVNLNYVSFRQVGSITSDAIQNIKLYVNGVQVGSTASISSDGRVIFDLSSAPVTLATGASTLELRGDIIKGSSLNYSFNIQLASDIVLTDTNYGVNVTAQTGSGVTYSGIGTIAQTKINNGSISISADPNFSANQVVKNASGVTLGQYTMKAYGEDVQVNNLVVKPTLVLTTATTTLAATEGVNNVSVFVNGAQVGSSQNFVFTAGGALPGSNTGTYAGTLSYGTNNLFTIPAGTTVTVTVKGDLTQLSSSYLSSVKADIAYVTAQGNSSFSTVTYGAADGSTVAAPTNQSLSIVSGNLTVAVNNALGSQSVIQNTQKVKIGSYILQAGSAEGVRISSISVGLGGTASCNGSLTNCLSNLYISANTNPMAPQTNNNFSTNNLTIASNGSQVIDVFADLGAITSSTNVTTSLAVTALGATTNATTLANSTGAAVSGQTMTIQTGALASGSITLVNNDPVNQLVSGGANQKIANFNFVASNGSANISEVKFKVVNNSGSVNTSDVVSISVNGVSAPVVAGYADITGLSITVPAGLQGLNIPVTATYAPVTSSGQGGVTMGDTVKLILANYKYTAGSNTQWGLGGSTESDGTVATSNLSILAASIPVVSLASDNPNQVSSGYTGSGASELMRFVISNSGANAINLKKFTLVPTYSSGAIASSTGQLIKVYDSADLNTVLNQTTSTPIGVSSNVDPIYLDNNFVINGNSSREIVVKADTTGTWSSTGTSIRLDLTSSVNSSTNDSISGTSETGTAWQWNDSTQPAGTYLNGYLVKNLPLTGNTFTH